MWSFIILFPLLLGHPAQAEVRAETREQCVAIRNLVIQQLQDHRSNAVVSLCTGP